MFGDAKHLARLEPLPSIADIYREYHGFVWRNLRRLGVQAADLDDAVQEVFLVIFHRLADFEHRSALRTWVFSITMRVAQGLRRDRRREQANRERFHTTSRPRLVSTMQTHEDTIVLHELLERLDMHKRAVFVLVDLEGMTAPEVSEILQVKLATVYSRLRLARQRLAAMLVPESSVKS